MSSIGEGPEGASSGGRSAFIICQVGAKGSSERRHADDVFTYIVSPAADEFGLTCKRSDMDPTPGQITTQIVRGIVDSNVVIADLTGANPNVYFELGVAQSFGRPLVLLVKDARHLPFDVKNERTIEIGGGDVIGASDADAAKKALTEALEVVLADHYEPTNLVIEAASARSMDDLAPTDPFASELAVMRETLDEVHGMVRAARDLQKDRSNQHDLLSLRALVEEKVKDLALVENELESLIGTETSERHDAWVRKMLELRETKEVEEYKRRQAYDEEPF